MAKISFINGKFLPHEQCFVHIEDRGFQFSDGVYEVILLKNNKLIDVDWHLERLFRSLNELQIKIEQNSKQLREIILELFAKNNLSDGSVYLQITRGSSPRFQAFPTQYVPTITATVSPQKIAEPEAIENGIKTVTHEDIRWKRCDIKSTALLAQSWIRQKSYDEGADDVIMIRDGYVTEASFANVFIVDENDNLITRNADNFILCGITRNRIIDLAKQNDIVVLEQKFTPEQLLAAKEVFLSSTTLLIRPVSKIDQKIIGNGKPGKISKKLITLYNDFTQIV
ncbi:MAG: branched-chain-amino-acid aminotransferase-like protein 2 [Rickettsiaceae bacterium]|jgi:D-alanine transaminase|nr:branched-chain-amino-acid aminotransferase-like protein 2 [Rickettsiaceae bacterium]